MLPEAHVNEKMSACALLANVRVVFSCVDEEMVKKNQNVFQKANPGICISSIESPLYRSSIEAHWKIRESTKGNYKMSTRAQVLELCRYIS